jgi:hypothetical protein
MNYEEDIKEIEKAIELLSTFSFIVKGQVYRGSYLNDDPKKIRKDLEDAERIINSDLSNLDDELAKSIIQTAKTQRFKIRERCYKVRIQIRTLLLRFNEDIKKWIESDK